MAERVKTPWPAALAVALGVLLGNGCADVPHYTPQHDFYVAPDGDDKNDGRSPGTAWRTLGRADREAFKPDDRLLLQAGATFKGRLSLGADQAGRAGKPLIIGSYGNGRATIRAVGGSGITVHNTAGVEIRDLRIVGNADSFARGSGISFYADHPGGRKSKHVRVSGVDVSGFRYGVVVGGGSGAAGFTDVRVSDSRLHDNKDAGLLTYGPRFDAESPDFAHEDVTLSRVEVDHNAGDPTAHDHHTGNGIILGSVRDGKVERSTAHDNGSDSATDAPEGPVGIWAYDSTRLVFQHNVSYGNRTGSQVDGSGFGLDQNTSLSTVQYNLSFGNDGAGYHAYTRFRNGAHHGNTIRFNISSDDGRKLARNGGLTVHGARIEDLQVHNNTVVLTRAGQGEATAVRVSGGPHGVALRNNLFVSPQAMFVDAAKSYTPAEIVLQGNDYYNAAGPWTVRWGNRTFTDLADWRSAVGQELHGSTPTGVRADPCLAGGRDPVITRTDGAAAMVPECDSPAGRGLDLRSLFGVDPGTVDYFGQSISGALPIGAVRPQPTG
ncbi:right-handed parallel beta-helix repeat-containing protein [Streptomyces sp. NPDC018833]|uniref:right-handed parallel beta-helix repeat-containing protein n=1 Tax=Streptomyces sp. NPDC018833 TaxID=3365053 RepID=UPI00379BDB6C